MTKHTWLTLTHCCSVVGSRTLTLVLAPVWQTQSLSFVRSLRHFKKLFFSSLTESSFFLFFSPNYSTEGTEKKASLFLRHRLNSHCCYWTWGGKSRNVFQGNLFLSGWPAGDRLLLLLRTDVIQGVRSKEGNRGKKSPSQLQIFPLPDCDRLVHSRP